MKKSAQFFKTLSDETRLRILALLTAGELCVCDLMKVLELPQSTVSRHLSNLRNGGWVDDRRKGLWAYYRLVKHEDKINDLVKGLPLKLSQLKPGQTDLKRLREYQSKKILNRCT